MKIAQILKLIRPCNLTLVLFCFCPVGVFFMQYGSSYKDKSDNHSQRHLFLLSHMSSAPLPEFQLKKYLNYLTASAARSGHTLYFLPLYTYSIRHLQSWRCSGVAELPI